MQQLSELAEEEAAMSTATLQFYKVKLFTAFDSDDCRLPRDQITAPPIYYQHPVTQSYHKILISTQCCSPILEICLRDVYVNGILYWQVGLPAVPALLIGFCCMEGSQLVRARYLYISENQV